MRFVPYHRTLIPYVQAPVFPGWTSYVTSLAPVVWCRGNTASGTEYNLGSAGGTVYFGSSCTRHATGGPVAGGGYVTNPASSGTSYMHSNTTTMWTTFTVAGWVKFPTTGNTQAGHSPTVFGKRQYYASSYTAFPFSCVWDQTNGRLQIILDSGNDFSADQTINTASSGISTAAWHFLVVVVRPSGSNVETYLDGSIHNTTAATTTCVTSNSVPIWMMGAAVEYGGGAGGSECVMDMAEFMVFNKALTSTEVSNMYLYKDYA